jgi:hypothetical protein
MELRGYLDHFLLVAALKLTAQSSSPKGRNATRSNRFTIQSSISLACVVILAARAVNIL